MDDVEFRVLCRQLSIAASLRNCMDKHLLEIKDVCERLELKPVTVKSILNGAFDISLREIAKIEAMADMLDRAKVKNELIVFPPYKDSKKKLGKGKETEK